MPSWKKRDCFVISFLFFYSYRCGFNSKGHEHVKQRLEVREKKGVLGVNLGKNKESESAEEDYVRGIMEFASVADYFTINVSSPNTPGLRSLQKRQALEHLLDKVRKKSLLFVLMLKT